MVAVANRKPGKKLSPAAAAAALRGFRENFMPIRRDWNQLGPPVPGWFRSRLRRIDPKLRLQFIPVQSTKNPRGVHPSLFPSGAWAVCRYLPRTGMLHKRWTLALADEQGNYKPPTEGLCRLIAYARDVFLHGEMHKLEQYFDESIVAATRAKEASDYEELLCGIAQTMRDTGMSSRVKPTVFFPS